MIEKIRKNIMLKSFIGPMIIGFFIGLSCYYLGNIFNIEIYGQSLFEIPVRLLYTISKNFLQLLLFVAPLMVVIYSISGVNQIRGNAKKFFLKFFSLVFITLLIISLISLVIGSSLVPNLMVEMDQTMDIYMDPYFIVDIQPLFSTIVAVIMGIIFGLFLPQDSLSMKLIHEGEEWISRFATGLLLPIMPIWVIGVFAQSAYTSSASSLFINDLILSTIILILQGLWLVVMYFIVTKITKRSFKKAFYAGLKLYVKVTSIMGMGAGIIVPFAIEAQKEIEVDEAVAKIVSVSSLNMPGSVISNIIFAYGVITMYGLDISTMQMIVYAVVLIFATMIAPSIPGGVFSVTSSLLTPILGFNADQIGLMGALYYKQGTSNAATNNAADVYLGPLMDSNSKI